MAAWKEGRKRGEGRRGNEREAGGKPSLSRASRVPSSWVEWVALGMRGACGVHFRRGGLARGTLAWVAPSHPGLMRPFHLVALVLFALSVCRRGMARLPAWVDRGGKCCPACWQCPVSRAPERQKGSGPRESAEGCGNRGCWARWVSWPLPRPGSPVGRLFPPGGSRGSGGRGPG